MPHTQWRPPPISLLRDPAAVLASHEGRDSNGEGGPAMTSSLYDLGIPYPIWPAGPTPAEASARAATRQGRQVHAAVARLAPLVPFIGEDDEAIEGAVASIVTGRENGNLRRARIRVSGLVRQYLRVFLPDGGVFAGSEVPAGGGRADLLWAHRVGYFFDEIKTRRSPDPLTPDVLAQVDRYRQAGEARFGPRFAGVRLITLGDQSAALALAPDGVVKKLVDTPLSPAALSAAARPRSRRVTA